MKIRHVLVIAIVIVIANATIGGVSAALKRSDYHHCRVTTHHTADECKDLTGYTPE